MSRNKLKRFAENEDNPNVIQTGKPLYEKIKGNWNELQFQNQNELVVELACGRGEYTIGLAQVFPEKNFVGVDIKGSRIWKGSNFATTHQLYNVAFLRTYIQNIHEFFAENEINEIWITFPDPRPKDRDEKRRLTHPRFLEMYRSLLKEGGIVHFKTDNTDLFQYSLEVLEKQKIKNLNYTFDLYQSDLAELHHGIRTRYEQIFSEKGERIKYLQFQFVD